MTAGVNSQKKKNHEPANYHRTQMQKEIVIQRLREQGCRITKQRLMLLDVILNEDCSCCKEIYYRAAEVDPGIGAATVYRMVNLLEEIGAIIPNRAENTALIPHITTICISFSSSLKSLPILLPILPPS